MGKETKSEYFHFKITPSLKKRLYDRSDELHKDPSDYVRGLVEKDCTGFDMTETEKPRMQEFAQKIANEFSKNFDDRLLKSTENIIKKTELNYAISCWIYRQVTNTFYNLAIRMNTVGSLKDDDIKQVNTDSTKIVNSMFEQFLDAALTNTSDSIFDYLKKPL